MSLTRLMWRRRGHERIAILVPWVGRALVSSESAFMYIDISGKRARWRRECAHPGTDLASVAEAVFQAQVLRRFLSRDGRVRELVMRVGATRITRKGQGR